MATPPPDKKNLPSIPSAANINNYYPATTPATQRLGVTSNAVYGSNTGTQRLVYLGQMDVQAPAGIPYKDPNKTVTKKMDRLVDAADARYMMYTLAPEAKKRLNDLTTAYFGHDRWDPSWQDGVWEQAIQVSANSVAYGNKGDWIDPVSAFGLVVNEMSAGTSGGRGGGGGGGGYSGPTTTMQTSKSVNLTDPTTARGLIKGALSGYLGRDATDVEQQSFLRALNAAERRNPTVTKATTTTTPQGVAQTTVESETMSMGGFNPSTFAEEYAQGMEGSAEFQAATTLLDTFIGSLKARV